MLTQLIVLCAVAQKAEIYGSVLNRKGKAFEPAVNIAIQDYPYGTTTDKKGNFSLKVPANKLLKIRFSYVSLKPVYRTIQLKPNERLHLSIILKQGLEIDTFSVTAKRHSYDGVIHVKPVQLEAIPTPNGDVISAFIKRIPGVYSNNELSAQYSVRGGNFDENLVYVNGIEIQRPLLIKSGQQEGLNFVNADMVSDIKFSAGGFSAYYGDKMASVLDVSYKEPKAFAGSVSGSLLGGSAHLEGVAMKQRLRYSMGLRYKTNQYVLKSLDTKGDYKPSFTDFQLFVSYDITDVWELSLLGNYALNNYNIIPKTRETNFGNIFEALRFTVYFDGHEVDRFENYMGAVNLKYHNNKTQMNFTYSMYHTLETENYDIMGQYWLDVLQNDLGKDDFGKVAFNKGVGTFLHHARNSLDGWISSLQHRGQYRQWHWGVNLRHDIISDRLSEWKMIDSSGFSLPHPADNIGNRNPTYIRPNTLRLNEVIKANQRVASNRYTAYIMRDWTLKRTDSSVVFKINAGLRSNYWDFSREFLLSPRASVFIKPNFKSKRSYRIAMGLYSQPPFYREMRRRDGSINKNIKAQKSAHFVLGTDWLFDALNRPFKFTVETYYKYMWDLIPYEMDDVRLRYFAENNAVGYATGIDLKLYGELVKNAESWLGLSIMQTQEDIKGDYYYKYYNAAGQQIKPGISLDTKVVDSTKIEPGFIPRPTDQRVVFNMLFQDYVPGYPTYKVHLNLVYATGLPFGPPTHKRYQQTRRYPAYRRVDIGFSKQLIGKDTKIKAQNPLRYLKSAWISLEVFNLLQIDNTLSYIWISDVNGSYYSIPNYLTSRQLNLRLILKF